jgi:hypothetical protein
MKGFTAEIKRIITFNQNNLVLPLGGLYHLARLHRVGQTTQVEVLCNRFPGLWNLQNLTCTFTTTNGLDVSMENGGYSLIQLTINTVTIQSISGELYIMVRELPAF